MRAMWMTFCAAALLGGAAHAAPAKRDCSKAAQRKARAAADKAVQAKDYKKAIALLEPFVRECNDPRDPVERAWLAGDLAVAYDKDGQPLACARLMAPLSHPKSGLQEAGNAKLVKAIEYNLDHCSKALDAQYAAITPGGCTLTVEHAIATAAVPPALLPRGATTACVALLHGTRAKDAEEGDVTCPRIALIWKGAKATLERQDLTASGDGNVLSDESSCCNLSSIAAGTLSGKALLRLRGQGRECSGGTSDTASDVFYEWKGTALATTLDASLVFH